MTIELFEWKAAQQAVSKAINTHTIELEINGVVIEHINKRVKEFEAKEKQKGKQKSLTG